MRSVFLCHASEDKAVAESIQLALTNAGCEVFFDAQSLPPGGDFQDRIRRAINKCDLFVFLISRASISKGKFTLSELSFARERWPSPVNRVLPVNLEGIPPRELPNYLSAATIMPVMGHPAVEVRSAVDSILKNQKRRFPRRFGLTLVIGSMAFSFSVAIWRLQLGSTSQPPSPAPMRGSALVYDGFRAYERSGFKFSTQSLVSWNSRSADVLAAKNGLSAATDFFIPYDAKDYKNPDLDSNAQSGIREMPNQTLDSLVRCPSDGYQYHWYHSRVGAVYCVRWRDGMGYSAIRVHTLDEDRIGFDYGNVQPSPKKPSP